MNFRTSEFDYHLPSDLIAKYPYENRGESRLLVVKDNLTDLKFNNIIDLLNKDDLIVFNNSKVMKARLYGHKLTGGNIEILVERVLENNQLLIHIKSNKKINIGLEIKLNGGIKISVIDINDGLFTVATENPDFNWFEYLGMHGSIPLPKYINRPTNKHDCDNYQTVYAESFGSVAAPTAGLHFSTKLITKIKEKGIKCIFLTLHVGSGTFKPITTEFTNNHKMHSEVYYANEQSINSIKEQKKNSGNIIAVGTTSIRTLEHLALTNFNKLYGETNIFITPGFNFQLATKLITNFHLPKSTLLMLVCAFAGKETIYNAYQYAINNKYKFFSYGDAMFLEKNVYNKLN